MRTKAAVVYEHDKPVVVDDLELKEPKTDEVLVRMAASGDSDSLSSTEPSTTICPLR